MLSPTVPLREMQNENAFSVAQEAENQKDELKKQRTNYIKKVSLLKKEMKVLKEQRNDLTSGEAPPSPTTKNFIEENDRLQVQIKKKLDTIENVIDMLNGIIGDEEAEEEQEETPKSQPEQSNSKSGQATGTSTTSDSSADSFDSSSSSSSSSDSSSEAEGEADNDNDTNSPTDRLKACAIQSMKAKQAAASKQADPAQNCNLVFFDPEQHWCESCNAFPKTARDYLKHLHAEEHMNRETVETPWHVGIDHDPFPTIDKAPVKRVPVRGLQFLVPASAWYCKLCSVWIGDLHCASAHLKSRMHANRYDLFLKKQPNYESEWHSKREKAQQQQKESEEVKQKKADEKVSKKRKKKSSDKKKKKRKHSKKHKRNATSTSSSTADSSSSDEEEHSKQQPKKEPVDAATATINAASIRVAMRKQEGPQEVAQPQVAPPPPPIIKDAFNADKRGKWTSSANEDGKVEEQKKRDDAMLQQWNPVISESEKKIIEDLKGKLKNKLRPGAESKSNSSAAVEEKPKRALSKRRSNSRGRSDRSERERRDRERDRERERDRDRDRERERRDRERDRDRERRRVRSSRSRSRGNRRSRSRDTRRRRSRSRQRSEERVERVERPVVKHSEFRPRAQPAPAKSTEPKKEKKEPPAKPKSTSAGGKKLPFIGKMPVLKKQPTVAPAIAAGYAEAAVYTNGVGLENAGLVPPPPPPPGGMSMSAATRAAAPTAAQIQMAMMEDVYGNAPPFHPDAGMMMDYDELMPDPVQFANLMTNCPPPPPPGGDSAGASSLDAEQMQEDAAEEDVLPPGIDEVEPDHMSQPLATTTATEDDGVLPQDFAEALDIIFPTERAGDEEADGNSNVNNVPQTITTIVEDEPVLDEQNLHDLAKQGIHLVSIDGNAKRSSIDEQLMEESSQTLDEAPALPLVNGNAATPQQIPMPATPPPPATTTTTEVAITTELKLKEREQLQLEVGDIPQPPDSPTDSEKLRRQAELEELAMLGIDSSDMAAQYAL
ncbi:zinc finger matrin-type protein CG9776 isoform X2 [Drosophila busckii]|uniref:zinc finger matrin-type protein CG9776 isoform X2 n=1 Tax=Drosophila busckii TaxID=30019 RepID=UPI0014334076|nr:zinc finger matrin-type protein CG9776 isoform X2 [Drosophila busckii]